MKKSAKISKPCDNCGKVVTRYKHEFRTNVFCGRACSSIFLSVRMSKMNHELNPDRMNAATREKLREAHIGKGSGVSYRKTFGKHTHRLVAAQKIGRPLLKGEVVHHIDGNRLNNNADNLMVFESQAAHALHHQKLIRENANPK